MNSATVTTAVKLSDTLRDEVKSVVEKKLGTKEFQLKEVVDEQVIGGVKITINSRVYDATVSGKIESLQV